MTDVNPNTTPMTVKDTGVCIKDRSDNKFLINLAIILLAAAATVGSLFGGPALGDHEGIVAECARQMRLSGDWLVPVFMDIPFVRKSPLPYWLIAAASYIFPNDPQTSLPVTTAVARLPSAISGFITVLLIWRLASSMLGTRMGRIAAVLTSSSIGLLRYSSNATAEMLMTCCCVWAYCHFWYGITTRTGRWRFIHMMLFYFALGMAMLAKGPAPIALTAMPLIAYWYIHRPLRIIARKGYAGLRPALWCFTRGLFTQTVRAFTQLWLIPGVLVFGLTFIPWMWLVAERFPYAWDLWNWQYWQRAQGHYEDTRPRGFFYYIPVVLGLVLPWLFLLFESLAAPWLKRYAHRHRALLYVGLWAVLGVLIMSIMEFKKPYYILPSIPAFLLLTAIVADRFYSWSPKSGGFSWIIKIGNMQKQIIFSQPLRLAWSLWGLFAITLIGGLIAGGIWLNKKEPQVMIQAMIIATGAVLLLLVAGLVYIRGRGWLAFALTALTSVAIFHTFWYTCGYELENAERARLLANAFNDLGVPDDARVLWLDSLPDSRLNFYYQRHSNQMITAREIVTRMVDRTTQSAKETLYLYVLERAEEVLSSKEPIYLIMELNSYNMLKHHVTAPLHHLTTVNSSPDTEKNDWVIVTNNHGVKAKK